MEQPWNNMANGTKQETQFQELSVDFGRFLSVFTVACHCAIVASLPVSQRKGHISFCNFLC